MLQSPSKRQQVHLGEDGRAEALAPCAVSWSQLEIKEFHKWKSSPKPSRAQPSFPVWFLRVPSGCAAASPAVRQAHSRRAWARESCEPCPTQLRLAAMSHVQEKSISIFFGAMIRLLLCPLLGLTLHSAANSTLCAAQLVLLGQVESGGAGESSVPAAAWARRGVV